MQEVFEKIKERLETELKCTRDKQSIECMKNDGFGTPLQAKYSGNIEMLLKAIEIVNQVAEEYKECALCYFGNPCEYQNKDARMPESELNNGWIPCSERLPEKEYDTVLAVTDRKHCCVAVYTKEHGFRTMDIDCVGVFIAWQPLPEPYRGE